MFQSMQLRQLISKSIIFSMYISYFVGIKFPEYLLQCLYINKSTQQMRILRKMRKLVENMDLFCPTEFFRYKREHQYQTFIGGALSVILMLALTIAFSNKLVATLNMMSITSSFSSENADDPVPYPVTTGGDERMQFMFGVEIWHFNLNDAPTRYFDIVLEHRDFANGDPTDQSVIYPLQQCTLQHWKGYPSIQQKFNRLNANFWLCPPKDTTFTIKGKYSSINSKTIEVSARKCSNQSLDPRPCASRQQIDQFFVDSGQKVYFTIYFTNPLLNPDQPQYLTHYLEDRNYIIFSQTGGEQAQLLMSDYQIITDDSIAPFQNLISDTGGIIEATAIKNRYQVAPEQAVYGTFIIFKSPLSIQISRTYQKLDDILSYIGGLLGTIVMLLFILKAYNGYAFEIMLGSFIYKHDEIKQGFKKYNFLYFIFHLIYSPLRYKLKSSGCWEKIKRYYICRREVLKQMDILYLLKRVSYLQRAIEVVFQEHQITGIHMMKRYTLDQAKKNRRKFGKLETMRHFQDEEPKITPEGAEDKQKQSAISNMIVSNNKIQNSHPKAGNRQIKKTEDMNNNNEEQEFSDSSTDSQAQQIKPPREEVLKIARMFRIEKDTSSISRRIYENLEGNLKNALQQMEKRQNVSRFSNRKQFYFLDDQIEGEGNSRLDKSESHLS